MKGALDGDVEALSEGSRGECIPWEMVRYKESICLIEGPSDEPKRLETDRWGRLGFRPGLYLQG